MAFALLVDILQIRATKEKAQPVKTREHYLPEEREVPKDTV
jgi:hypothetical protein